MGNTNSVSDSGTVIRTVQEARMVNRRHVQTINTLHEQHLRTEMNLKEKDMTIVQLRSEIENLQSLMLALTLEQEEQSENSSLIHEGQHGRLVGTCTQETQTDHHDLYYGGMILQQGRYWKPYTLYSPDIVGRWFTSLIERDPDAEPPGYLSEAYIPMYNAQSSAWCNESIIQDKLTMAHSRREKMYYHATDAGSARNILENGIDLSKSRRSVDFSSGGAFYVTDHFQRSIFWSQKAAGWTNSRGAIIGFKISHSLQIERPHLSLTTDSDTNRKWWECIVSHFRHGQTSPDVTNVLRDVKFIVGPVANNRNLGPRELPIQFQDFIQVCIRDKDYAQRFGSLQNIAFVIFFV